MSKVTIKNGIPALMASLDEKTLDGIEEVAERVAEGAKERVPVDSGGLRDAIHVERTDDAIRVIAGDTDHFYGHFVEFGTTRRAARPFLTPAFEAERDELGDVIGEQIEGSL
jgi:HK97 gp10 family phage protein